MKKIITLLLLCSFFSVDAQIGVGDNTDHEILQKYWYYRWRLRNDFVYIGTEAGESLPISERNINEDIFGSMGLGDVTQLLGYYINTLATEHKLLSDENRTEDLPMTRTELYYAYKAFERLDYAGEDLFPKITSRYTGTNPGFSGSVDVKEIERHKYTPELNGFFMRNDFPRDFFGDPFVADPNYVNPVSGNYEPWATGPCSSGGSFYSPLNDHYVHLNNNITTPSSAAPVGGTGETLDWKISRYEADPFGATCNDPYTKDWSTDKRTDPDDNSFNANIPGSYKDMDEFDDELPSTDQVGTLLQAFLITKVAFGNYNYDIPVTLLDGSIVQVNFVQLAKDNADRIITYLKDSNPNNSWKMYKPNEKNVKLGGDYGQYSFPISQIGNMIHDINLILPYYNIQIGYHNTESILKRPLWNSYQNLPPDRHNGPLHQGIYIWNSHSDILNYASTSGSWITQGPWFVPSSYYVLNRVNHTTDEVLNTADTYGWDPFHAMVLGYLHGKDMNNLIISTKAKQTGEKMNVYVSGRPSYVTFTKASLAKAPCTGCYNRVNLGDPGVLGWNSSKRWHGPYFILANDFVNNTIHKDPDLSKISTGYYSGLDFMMLHNLYYINSNQALPKYVNYIYRHYDEDLPNVLAGQNPLGIAGYESLTADNTIGSQMAVTYQASTEIHLTTDFHATAGVDFHAVIQDVTCGLDFKSATLDTTQSSYGMSAFGERKVYADISDKFEHLYVLPDSITPEFLDLQIAKMNKTNPYNKDAFAYDFSSCELELKSNTVTDQLLFAIENTIEEISAYKIFDLNGKLVLEGVLAPYQTAIVTNQLPTAMYLIQVLGKSQNCSAKFVKK